LDPETFREFKLVERRQLSHNVAKFRFALPTPTSVLGLPIGQHISCRSTVFFACFLYSFEVPLFVLAEVLLSGFDRGKDSVGEEVVKPYTPTTLDSDIGYFELVIKV